MNMPKTSGGWVMPSRYIRRSRHWPPIWSISWLNALRSVISKPWMTKNGKVSASFGGSSKTLC